MVFYRKYRPQKIQDLDSKELRERLFAVLSNSSVPHAFLFTGPKGLGKTSTARIVAKAVNCELRIKNKIKNKKEKTPDSSFIIHDSSSIEPCNECDQCISITNGSNLDVLEIDGASNRGIDEIRDLREKIKLAPVKAKKKIYIIDEVHMLTVDAFNALLKTLEEPPEHAMFIFCTTEFSKVPSTILSRCFQISFYLATEDELCHSLDKIISAENISIDKEVVQNIAHLSDGSFRDAAKILEELAALSRGKKITKEILDSKYKVLSIKYSVDEFLKALSEKNIKQGIESISRLVEQGVDMKYFLEQLLSFLHALLLRKVGIEKENFQFQIPNFKFQMQELRKLIDLFSKAHAELKYAVIPQLPLELAVIEYCQAGPSFIVHGSLQAEQKTSQSKTEQQAVQVGDGKQTIKPEQINKNNNLWGNFIDAVKIHNHTIAGVLRGCSLKSFDETNFIIETAFKFHKEKLSDQKAVQIMEAAYSEMTGKQVRILIQLKDRQ